MIHISLFSGIGGFDLAAEWAGWTNAVSCEISEFNQRVLKYYWPESYHHDDIHTLTGEKINEEIEKRIGNHWRANGVVLTGGFPCQPYSGAGARKGKDDSRHLWPEMLRVVKELKPDWVVGENVYGIINWNEGLVFQEVQTDLESQDYDVQSYVLPACSVGAAHKRDRTWFVARRRQASSIHYNANTDISERSKGRLHEDRSKATEGHVSIFHSRGVRSTWRDNLSEPALCSGGNGLSERLVGVAFSKWRNRAIAGLGNAVVPQLAYQIFKTINECSIHSNR